MPITSLPNPDSALARRRLQRRTQPSVNLSNQKPKRKRFFLFLIIGIYILASAIAWQTKLFTVKHIECHLTDGSDCSENLNAQLSYYLDGKFILSNLSEELGQAFSHHYSYQFVSARRDLPNTLSIQAQAIAMVYTIEQSGQKWSIDRNGGIHQYTEQQLPVVQTENLSLQESTELDQQLHHQFIQLIETLTNVELPDTTIAWVSNSEIRLQLPENKTVLLKLDDLPTQLMLFQKLKAYPFEKTDWTELDLRFEKPLLR